jgi:hypothetical protein
LEFVVGDHVVGQEPVHKLLLHVVLSQVDSIYAGWGSQQEKEGTRKESKLRER